MSIKQDNKHDYYAPAVSTVLLVIQFKGSIVNLHCAIDKCRIALKESMLKELENETQRT